MQNCELGSRAVPQPESIRRGHYDITIRQHMVPLDLLAHKGLMVTLHMTLL